MDEELEAAKEGGWREIAAIDAAYAAGELDDAGWHEAMAALVVPAYLAAGTPEVAPAAAATPPAGSTRARCSPTRSSPGSRSSTSAAPTGT